jgi:hypothetical protein
MIQRTTQPTTQQSLSHNTTLPWFLKLWGQWIVANSIGELLGLGLVAAIGGGLVWRFGEPAEALGVLLLTAALLLLGACEGVIVGVAQWLALRHFVPLLKAGVWIRATATGAFIAWALGLIPSTLMNLREAAGAAPPVEMSDATMFMLAVAMGLGLGAILGLPQWLALRRRLSRAGWWVMANAVAWAVGMPVIFSGAGSVPQGMAVGSLILFIALTLAVAGAIVGAIHGFALVWLLNQPENNTTLAGAN